MARASPIAAVIHMRFGFQPISAITQIENASSIAAQSGNASFSASTAVLASASRSTSAYITTAVSAPTASDTIRPSSRIVGWNGFTRERTSIATANAAAPANGASSASSRLEGVQGVLGAAAARVVDRADEPCSERDAGGDPGRALVVHQARARHAGADGEQREAVEGPARRQLAQPVAGAGAEERVRGVERQPCDAGRKQQLRGLAVSEDLALHGVGAHRVTVNFAVAGPDLPPAPAASAVAR